MCNIGPLHERRYLQAACVTVNSQSCQNWLLTCVSAAAQREAACSKCANSLPRPSDTPLTSAGLARAVRSRWTGGLSWHIVFGTLLVWCHERLQGAVLLREEAASIGCASKHGDFKACRCPAVSFTRLPRSMTRQKATKINTSISRICRAEGPRARVRDDGRGGGGGGAQDSILARGSACTTCATAWAAASATVAWLKLHQRWASFSSAPAPPLPAVSQPHMDDWGGAAQGTCGRRRSFEADATMSRLHTCMPMRA